MLAATAALVVLLVIVRFSAGFGLRALLIFRLRCVCGEMSSKKVFFYFVLISFFIATNAISLLVVDDDV